MRQILFFGLFLICLESCGQKELTKDDFIYVHKVIDMGEYSPHFYLKAIIEGKIDDKKLKKIMKKMGEMDGEEQGPESWTSDFCQGLVSSILKNTYNNQYENSQIFQNLDFKEFQGKKYFYQNVPLRGNKELFLWGIYNSKESENKLFSVISDSARLMPQYEFEIKTINAIEIVAFYAVERCVLSSFDGKMAKTIRYQIPESIKKTGVYRDCIIKNDTVIDCSMTEYTGTSDEIAVGDRLFASTLLYDDLDNDGALEGYWVVATNGSLIYSEVFEINEKGVEKSNQITLDKIPQNKRIIELLKISTLKQKPGL